MPPPRLSQDSPAALVLASQLRVVVGGLRRRLQERAGLDLTPSHTAVLVSLERDGPTTVTALARGAGMRPQSMGANVAALEAAGLVASAPDPDDGRRSLLSLTVACRERIREGRLAREDWLARALEQSLSASEQKELARAIELLQRLVDS